MTEGGLDMNPNFQSAIAIASQLISTFISILTVERLGRKIVWIISSAICAIGLLIFALNEKFKLSNILPVVCIFVFLFGFSYGIGTICWFIVSETFESDIRPAANSVCLIANWIFSFVIVISFPSMKKTMTMFGTSIFFFFICIFGIIWGVLMISEPNKYEHDKDMKEDKEESYDSSEKNQKASIV